MKKNPFDPASKRKERARSGEQEYWLSYSDLMAGLLLVFVLMLMVAIERYNDQAERYETVRTQVVTALQTMAVRDSIIRDLREIKAEMISIDTVTGAVRMNDAVLFDENEASLKPRGREVLRIFAESYIPIIHENRRYQEHLREISIVGHTNDNGPYDYNMQLSQRRAYAVMEFLLETTAPGTQEREFLERYLTARGRSYSQAICAGAAPSPSYPDDCGSAGVDKVASRRIEIRFRLDDEEVVREVKSKMSSHAAF